MSGAHTPGPWHIDAVMGEDRHEICAEPTAESGNPNVIATVFCDLLDPHPAIGLTEANANARLIAAAPDLLAALRELVKRCPFVATPTGIRAEISFAQIKQAQDALAKVQP